MLDNKIVSTLPYSREVMRSINKGKPAIVSAVNSDISKKLAGGMRQFLSGEVTPVLGTEQQHRRNRRGARVLAFAQEGSHPQGA